MGEKMNPQDDRQLKKPKAPSRKRRVVLAALGILAVGLGAWAIWRHMTQKPEITLDLGNNVKMRLVLIPAGKFLMGSPANEKDRGSNEGPQHEVTISKPFYMGVFEVTQEQYEAAMGKNPSKFKGATNPVEWVSWDEATEFCKKLSARTGKTVRLPKEAQWEYACRAGTTTPFNTGAALRPDQANFIPCSSTNPGIWGKIKDWIAKFFPQKAKANGPTPVGNFPPNGFGLYDMHGNVWEWCYDWYDEKYYANAKTSDPQGPDSGLARVLRGGSWNNYPLSCRSANRYGYTPDNRDGHFGFRVSVDLK